MIVNDINWVEQEISPVIKNTLSLWAVESVSGAFMMDSDATLIRAAKRGVLWTLSEQLEQEIMTMNSDIRNQNVWPLVDRVFWNAVIAGGIEVTNVYQVLDNALTSIQPSELKNAFETAVLIYLSRKITDKFDNQLKHISTLFGK